MELILCFVHELPDEKTLIRNAMVVAIIQSAVHPSRGSLYIVDL